MLKDAWVLALIVVNIAGCSKPQPPARLSSGSSVAPPQTLALPALPASPVSAPQPQSEFQILIDQIRIDLANASNGKTDQTVNVVTSGSSLNESEDARLRQEIESYFKGFIKPVTLGGSGVKLWQFSNSAIHEYTTVADIEKKLIVNGVPKDFAKKASPEIISAAKKAGRPLSIALTASGFVVWWLHEQDD